jgi:polyphosphate kinase
MPRTGGGAGSSGPAGGPTGASRYLNRELSWLDFNRRVLALAEDPGRPLLERVRFLAISASNLDEFFQVRVAGLAAQLESGVLVASPDGLLAGEQLQRIRPEVEALVARQEELLAKALVPELAAAGIELCAFEALDPTDQARASSLFDEKIFPVLTPLSVDPAHPFPYISSLSLSLAIVVAEPGTGEHRFARVKVPPIFPRWLAIAPARFVAIEEVIAAHAGALFPGMEIVSCSPFRVTRDAELAISEGEADDLLAAIESGLKRRLRHSAPVRLEVSASMSAQLRDLLAAELELEADAVYALRGPLGLAGLGELASLDRHDLREEPATPWTQPRLALAPKGDAGDLFEVLKQGDVLVHHPYDSFRTSVEAFLAQAAADPDVLAIKHTLYRTSGPSNPVALTLIRAAEAGKQVVTLVELKARFDEQANIEWARTLEQAGVHVVYGLVGLKAHGKIALVVRREGEGIRRYCHIGTGNYNPATATTYEDVGLLSASAELGADLTELFNHLTGCGRPQRYRKLLVAPAGLRAALLAQIRQEAEAPDGCLVLKVNALEDPEIIEALYAASAAGVEIDLVVRGICCLRPGVPGLSERIRVRSLVGRFLEHSRIFRFGSPARGRRYFIGSADLMTRNLDRRVEVVTPVESPELCHRLEEILATNLADDSLAWELGPDGGWVRAIRGPGIETHRFLLEQARDRAHPVRVAGATARATLPL